MKQLRHLDAVNIGAAGTFVIRKPITPGQLHEEIARRLPLKAQITICEGREMTALLSHSAFISLPMRSEMVRFVSVLPRLPPTRPKLPIFMPSRGSWLLKVLARKGRFVLGVHRRHMKVIGYLGKLDGLFGVTATTRSWATIAAIAKAL